MKGDVLNPLTVEERCVSRSRKILPEVDRADCGTPFNSGKERHFNAGKGARAVASAVAIKDSKFAFTRKTKYEKKSNPNEC
jgi:hypothetical protein